MRSIGNYLRDLGSTIIVFSLVFGYMWLVARGIVSYKHQLELRDRVQVCTTTSNVPRVLIPRLEKQ